MKIIQCNLCGAHIRSVSLSNHLKTRLHLKRMADQDAERLKTEIQKPNRDFAHFIASSLTQIRMEFEKETSNTIDETVIPGDAYYFEDFSEDLNLDEIKQENIVLDAEINAGSVYQCFNVLSLPIKNFENKIENKVNIPQEKEKK